MKKNIITFLIAFVACISQSDLFVMNNAVKCDLIKKFSNFLEQDKKDNGDRAKKYVIKHMDLVKQRVFKPCPDYAGIGCCSLLYLVAVVHKNIGFANWLLLAGAGPVVKYRAPDETENILRSFIEYDKKFNNKALISILKQNKKLIFEKDCFNSFKDFIDQAKEHNNSEAEKALIQIGYAFEDNCFKRLKNNDFTDIEFTFKK